MKEKWNPKKLGFGLMRLPKKDGVIDVPEVARLADAYLAAGFTYFDTAYVYDGSEVAFREAVAKRIPRESYTLANKLPGWLLSEENTPEKLFGESLERCGVEYFDYYLLHSLQPSRVGFYDKYDCWNFVRKKKEEGKIRYLGFSFHGGPELLDELLTKHPDVDFVQLQINYADWEDNAIFSGANYEVCQKHGKDVVVMEPNKGGFLADLKPEIHELFEAVRPGASDASMAFRFVGSLPGVKMILSGMNAGAQMEDNLATFTNFEPLNQAEREAIAKATKAIHSIPTVPCTACRYCTKGCPMGIDIPDIFKSYNMLLTYGEHNRPHFYYQGLLDTVSNRANACIQCGQCEAACPQHIPIIEKLQAASALLDQ